MALIPDAEFEDIPIPGPEGSTYGLASKLETLLVRSAIRIFSPLRSPLVTMAKYGVDYVLEAFADSLKPMIMPYLDKLDTIDGLPTEIKSTIRAMKGTDPLTITGLAVTLVVSIIVGLVMGVVQPIIRIVSQETDSVVRSSRLQVGDAFAAYKRGAISLAEYENSIKDLGWPDWAIRGLEAILEPLISSGDLSKLFMRGLISEAEFDSELTKRGYDNQKQTQIKSLLFSIPPVGDIISMAVREAFTPSVVSLFELESELPPDYVKYARQQGLTEEWAKAYWVAHWHLPSLTMGYEMLHRNIIGPSELELLIKAHDISPFWRDKLVQLSYSPFTRVDVRRMYELGVLGEEEVKQAYKDLGYSDDKAEKMLQFTIVNSLATERDLTKTDILYGYREGFFAREIGLEYLTDLGYSNEEANYYLDKEDYKKYNTILKEELKTVKALFVASQIEENEVYEMLGKFNLPATQMNTYLRLWEIERNRKLKRPTEKDLEKFFLGGIIGEESYRFEMKADGYSDKYIDWYVELLIQSMGG